MRVYATPDHPEHDGERETPKPNWESVKPPKDSKPQKDDVVKPPKDSKPQKTPRRRERAQEDTKSHSLYIDAGTSILLQTAQGEAHKARCS